MPAPPKIPHQTEADSLPPRWQACFRWGAPALTLAALALLAWNCLCKPEIRFLSPGPGRWIIYPLPPAAHPYAGMKLTGTFRRAFILPEKPAAASLSWRCMTHGELSVNNIVVSNAVSDSGNWKRISQLDIAPFLQQGSNEISVVVVNQPAPPALSLELKSGNFRLISDESWEVSLSGSDWRPAQAAAATPRPGKGNELFLLETMGGAFCRCWPWLGLFAAISAGGVALVGRSIGRITLADPAKGFPKMIMVALAAVWVLLFLHNFPFIPVASGFDAPQHLQYVSFLQEHHRLPDAREGWEMFQPPLYYIICARILDLGQWKAFDPSGAVLLRFLGLAIVAANLALVFAGLRMIFPGDWKKPLAGLVLAAFLPAQLCLAHYTTNETLSAMWVTAALCVGLYLLRARQPWWGWHGVLGIILGLALLSKSSAVLAVPVVLGALALKLVLRRERAPLVWLGAIGAPLAICLALSGWHYLELWREFGNPLIGSWDPKLVPPWWQTKGFQTPGYYFSFGDSFTRPFFSGLHGFWDAFYTTLWGDGLLGGKVDVWGRPPWNYDFMTVGFVLALAPTALVLTGAVRALAGCFRAANVIWLMLIGLGWLFFFAILDMSINVPSYSHTKAFFGLPALLPFCALGALGFEYWSGCGKLARYVLWAFLGLWLVNLYASFWIKPNSAQAELASAIAASVYVKGDASEAFSKVLNDYPGNSHAAIWLASLEAWENPTQAAKRLEQALKADPDNAAIESYLAVILVSCNQLDEALVHGKRAVELAPEDEVAARTWCGLELRQKNYKETVAAARYALSINPSDAVTHLNLGLGLMNLGQFPEAGEQFSALTDSKPAWAEAQFYLGVCLLQQPHKREGGLIHLGEAVRLNPTNSVWQTTLENARKGL